MTGKSFKIEEYLAPPLVRADWVNGFLKAYKIVLTGCDEEDLEDLLYIVKYDWKQFNKSDDEK